MATSFGELCRLDARALASGVRGGEFSAVDVVESHIERIEAVNPALNAVVVKRYGAAREEAREADRRRWSGEPLGPLHGVPITVKECIDVAGTPSSFGVSSHANDIAVRDSEYVARLRSAGAIVLGKTNLAQVLLYLESDNPLYGCARNPWDLERTPGGSSGGEGAIIALGGSPLGLGTDIGGSSRVPAAWSGVVGFKPTAGRMPDFGRGSISIGQRAIASQVGVFARTVGDVALGVEIANGGALPSRLPPMPLRDFERVNLEELVIGYYTDDGTFDACSAAKRAVLDSVRWLERCGATLVPFSPPDVGHAMRLFFGILSGDGGKGVRRFLRGSRLDPRIAQLLTIIAVSAPMRALIQLILQGTGRRRLAALLDAYGDPSADRHFTLVAELMDYQARFQTVLDRGPGDRPVDAILSPPVSLPAFRHGASSELGVAGAYALVYNVLGYPAGVVPVTRVRPDEEIATPRSSDKMDRVARDTERGSRGLPMAVQVAARPFREDVAFAVMAALERAARTEPDYPDLGPLVSSFIRRA
jgi:fatty acid amide hydrolase